MRVKRIGYNGDMRNWSSDPGKAKHFFLCVKQLLCTIEYVNNEALKMALFLVLAGDSTGTL